MKSRNFNTQNKVSIQVQTEVQIADQENTYEIIRYPLREEDTENIMNTITTPYSNRPILNIMRKQVGAFKKITNLQGMSQDQLKKRLHLLESQIEGLCKRQIRFKSQNGNTDYYSIISQLQQKLQRQQTINMNYETKIKKKNQRIKQLQKQIAQLNRLQFDKNAVAQQNQKLKECFIKLNQSLLDKKNTRDFENYIKKEVNPILNQFKIEISDLNKKYVTFRTNDDQKSKIKVFVNNFLTNLDKMFKSPDRLNLQNLRKTALAFCKQLSIPDQVNCFQNDGIAYKYLYEQLNQHFTAFSSMCLMKMKQTVDKYPELNEILKVQELQKIATDFQLNFSLDSKIIYINNKSNLSHHIITQDVKTKKIITILINQFKKLISKYPQIEESFPSDVLQLLKEPVINQAVELEQLQRIQEIIKYKPQIIRVDNVYSVSQQKNLKEIFHLKIFVKILLEELNKIISKTGQVIQIDEGVFNMINQEIQSIGDYQGLIKNFRSCPKIIEVDRIVQRDVGKYETLTQAHPIRIQQAIIVEKVTQKPIIIKQYVPIHHEKIIESKTTQEVPVICNTQTPIIVDRLQQVIVEKIIQKQIIQEVQVTKQVPIIQSCIQQVDKIIIQQKIVEVPKQVIIEKVCPVKQYEIKFCEVERFQEKLVEVVHEINNIKEIKVNVPYPVIETKYVQVENIKNNFIPVPEIKQIIKQVACVVQHTRQKPVNCIQTIQKIVIQKTTEQVIKEVVVSKQVCLIQEKPTPYKEEVTHFIKGDKQQIIVEVQRIKQIPIIKQKLVLKEIQIQKCVPILCKQQVPVLIQVNLPYIQYEPQIVNCEVQKVIPIRQQIPYEVIRQIPVPIIIEKECLKPVRCIIEKVIQKIVEVPRVVQVQKIVEKIVIVPRIIQNIVIVPQIVEVISEKQVQVLKIVEIQKPYPVYTTKQVIKIVEQKIEVPVQKIQYQIVQKQKLVVLSKMIQKIKQVFVEKRIPYEVIHNVPIQLVIQKIVQRIIQINNLEVKDRQVIVPYKHEIPIEVINQIAVPLFKIIENIVQVPQLITRPQILYQTKMQSQIKQIYIEKPIEVIKQVVYTDIKHVIENSIQYVELPPKQICAYSNQIINKIQPQPYIVEKLIYINNINEQGVEIRCQKPLLMRNDIIIEVEKPVNYIQKKEIPRNIITEKIVENKTTIEKIKPIEIQSQKVITLQNNICETKEITKQIIKTITKQIQKVIKTQVPFKQQIIKSVQIPGKTIHTQEILKEKIMEKSDLIIQKVVQKISLLPQIVQVVKHHYEVAIQKNLNLTTETNPKIHKQNYIQLLTQLDNSVTRYSTKLKQERKKDSRLSAEIQKIEKLRELIQRFIKFPLIIEIPKQVEKIVQKQKIIVLPNQQVQSTQNQIASGMLIEKLIQELKRISTTHKINIELDEQIKKIFFINAIQGSNFNEKLKLFENAVISKFESLGNWTPNHSSILNTFMQQRFLMASIIQESNENIQYLKDQLQISQLNQQKMKQVITKLNIHNISLKNNLNELTRSINEMTNQYTQQQFSERYGKPHSISKQGKGTKQSKQLKQSRTQKSAKKKELENEKLKQIQKEKEKQKQKQKKKEIERQVEKITKIHKIQDEVKNQKITRLNNQIKNLKQEIQNLVKQKKQRYKRTTDKDKSASTRQRQLQANYEKKKQQLTKSFENLQVQYNLLLVEFNQVKKNLTEQTQMNNKLRQQLLKSSTGQQKSLRMIIAEMQIKIQKLQMRIRELQERIQRPTLQSQQYRSEELKSRLLETRPTGGYQVQEKSSEERKLKQQKLLLVTKKLQLMQEEQSQKKFGSPQSHRKKRQIESSIQGQDFSFSSPKDFYQMQQKSISQEQSSESKISVVSLKQPQITQNLTLRQLISGKTINEFETSQIIRKLVKRISQDTNKGRYYFYTPQIIRLIGYSPDSIDQVKIQFSIPTKENQKLYLSPEVLSGYLRTQKSCVFNIGIIWDEMLHFTLYFKTTQQIQSSVVQYKIRNNSLNAIYKNTLSDMLAKDQSKRIDLNEVERRLSFQKYKPFKIKNF